MLKLNQLNFIQNIEKNLALGFQISSKYPDFCIKKLPWVNLSLKLKIEISEFSWVIISHSEFFFFIWKYSELSGCVATLTRAALYKKKSSGGRS